MAGIADKNHKRYVDLAKTNFDTAQALTKQYTDFYDKLVNQIGNVDATQRGVMETVVQSVSDKIKNLESMNKKYVDDMADPLHKYIDAQTTEYTAEAGSQAKTKANIASWEEADPKMREELIVNNLVRLAGSTPGFDVQLKSISPEELQSALKFPTLIQGLQSLVAKHPAIATAIKNAQSSTSSV